MLGAMKSTPIVEMQKMGRMQTLGKRRDTKVVIQAEKFQRMPSHSMKERFQNLAMEWLKKISFIHQAK